MAKQTETGKVPRAVALGINFEDGAGGYVVVYTGTDEMKIAEIPKNYSCNEKSSTALAVVFRQRGGKKPLTSRQSKAVLDSIIDDQHTPVVVNSREIEDILQSLARKGLSPQTAV